MNFKHYLVMLDICLLVPRHLPHFLESGIRESGIRCNTGIVLSIWTRLTTNTMFCCLTLKEAVYIDDPHQKFGVWKWSSHPTMTVSITLHSKLILYKLSCAILYCSISIVLAGFNSATQKALSLHPRRSNTYFKNSWEQRKGVITEHIKLPNTSRLSLLRNKMAPMCLS